ncbi:hypothetical protein M885DRAFT_45285 [Pelagophyceae sp. CCMP2097]|nr:hypothetical protein M885DRAFT_45285 [Pelagophyceae sp. CCMP2097]
MLLRSRATLGLVVVGIRFLAREGWCERTAPRGIATEGSVADVVFDGSRNSRQGDLKDCMKSESSSNHDRKGIQPCDAMAIRNDTRLHRARQCAVQCRPSQSQSAS